MKYARQSRQSLINPLLLLYYETLWTWKSFSRFWNWVAYTSIPILCVDASTKKKFIWGKTLIIIFFLIILLSSRNVILDGTLLQLIGNWSYKLGTRISVGLNELSFVNQKHSTWKLSSIQKLVIPNIWLLSCCYTKYISNWNEVISFDYYLWIKLSSKLDRKIIVSSYSSSYNK